MLLSIIPLVGIASLAHNRYHPVATLATIAILTICCINATNSIPTAIILSALLTTISLVTSTKNAHIYILTIAAIITAIHLAPINTLGNKKITQGIIVVQE